MSTQILSGRKLSKIMRAEMKTQVESLIEKGITPGLAVVLVGSDPASKIYVGMKKKACDQLGIRSFEYILDEDASEEELLELVETLNDDKNVDGILVQLPLPDHIDENKVINKISPKKDVDGFHPINIGRLVSGQDCFVPCTPAGIIELIKMSEIEIQGKNCVVVGRSNIVGKPVSLLLLKENGTVTICHSKTKDLTSVTKEADILVAAVGKAKVITADMVKPGAVVIDVGVNRLENNKLAGDVDYEGVFDKVKAITPVPGGVGPMTITMLMKNTLKSAENR